MGRLSAGQHSRIAVCLDVSALRRIRGGRYRVESRVTSRRCVALADRYGKPWPGGGGYGGKGLVEEERTMDVLAASLIRVGIPRLKCRGSARCGTRAPQRLGLIPEGVDGDARYDFGEDAEVSV